MSGKMQIVVEVASFDALALLNRLQTRGVCIDWSKADGEMASGHMTTFYTNQSIRDSFRAIGIWGEKNSPEEVTCRSVLNRPLTSFFGPDSPKRILYLVNRLLERDVKLVRDLLMIGPTRWSKYDPVVNVHDVRYVVETLAEHGLVFTDANAVLMKTLVSEQW